MQKKSLSVWSWISVLLLFLSGTFFFFSLVYEGIGLYNTNTDIAPLGNLAILDISSLIKPILAIGSGLSLLFNDFLGFISSYPETYLIFGIVFFILVFLIIHFIVSIIKKPKYVFLTFYIGILSFAILYFFMSISISPILNGAGHELVSTSGSGIISSLISKSGNWYNILLFQSPANIIQTILIYLFFFSLIGLMISYIGIVISSLKIIAIKKPKKAIIPVQEDQVNFVEEKKVEPIKEEVKPKEEKTLVVRRFDRYSDNRTIEKVCDYPEKPLTKEAMAKLISSTIKEELLNDEIFGVEINEVSSKDVKVSSSITENKIYEEENPTPIIITIPTMIEEINNSGNKINLKKKLNKESSKQSLDKETILKIVNEEFKKALEDFKLDQISNIQDNIDLVVDKEDVELNEEATETIYNSLDSEINNEVKLNEENNENKEENLKEEINLEEDNLKESEDDTSKYERISFATRIANGSELIKTSYNEIKNLLLSYGLNNRLSNGGDAFRLHKVTYCKITVAGKALKLYLALDPNEFNGTNYSFKDVSNKGIYKEIPFEFKIKNNLTLKKAKELIAIMMEKHNFTQINNIDDVDYANEILLENSDSKESE